MKKARPVRSSVNPSSTFQRLARRWIAIGATGVAFASSIALAVFVFGMPSNNIDSGREATQVETATSLLMVGGAASVFLVLGLLIRRNR